MLNLLLTIKKVTSVLVYLETFLLKNLQNKICIKFCFKDEIKYSTIFEILNHDVLSNVFYFNVGPGSGSGTQQYRAGPQNYPQQGPPQGYPGQYPNQNQASAQVG